MLDADRLAEITALCDRPTGNPEAERYRAMCGELLDQVAELAEMDMTHVRRLITEHGQLKNDDLVDTGRKTESWLRTIAATVHSPNRRR